MDWNVPVICVECKLEGVLTPLGSMEELCAPGNREVTCERCNSTFRVFDGIPVLVPESLMRPANVPQSNENIEYQEFDTHATKKVAHLVQSFSRGISLDIGCGKGPYTEYFEGPVVVTDINFHFVQEAELRHRKGQRVTGVVADARVLPFPPCSFDFVFCSEVIEHLDQFEVIPALAEMKSTANEHVCIDTINPSSFLETIRRLLVYFGVFGGKDFEDEALMHHSEVTARILRREGFSVRGCIGWVSRDRIRLGLLWDVYDLFVWRLPFLAGTIVGIRDRRQARCQ